MKKQLLMYLAVFLTAHLSHSQISSLKWAKQHGGASSDQVKAITTDLSGNVISGGVFSGTANFDIDETDLEFTSLGYYDGFVSKLDVNGDFQWAIQIGNENDNYVSSVATDNNENIYVSGAFQGVVDFNPKGTATNLTSAGSTDGFIAKYNPSGNLIWAKQISGTSQIDVFSVKVDNVGNVYSVGTFYLTADFDPGAGTVNLTSQGEFDGFVLKLDGDGDFLWVNHMKGDKEVTVMDIEIDSNDDVIAIGDFSEDVDFHPTGTGASISSTFGFISAFFLKLDNAGGFVWVKQIGGTGNVYNTAIVSDASNNLYVVGEYTSNISFNPNANTENYPSLGAKDGFLLKLTSTGDYAWVKNMGGVSNVRTRDVGIGTDNQVYVTGSYGGSVNFNLPQSPPNSMTSSGLSDAFVAQYKMSNGVIVDINSIGSTAGNSGLALAVSNNGLVHVGGEFSLTVDFNPLATTTELTSLGGLDGFIIQLGDCVTTGIDIQEACGSFVWNGVTYNSSNHTATKTLTNAEGCDSIVTLNLTINQPVTHTEPMLGCDSSVIDGTTYYASQNVDVTYSGAAQNGCDSIVTYNLTIAYPVTRTEAKSGCDTVIVNGTAYTSSQQVINAYPRPNACDSVVTTNITVKHSEFTTDNVTACGSAVVNGTTYTSSQTIVDTYVGQAQNFCDVIKTTVLVIDPIGTSTANLEGCGSVVYDGTTYTTSQTVDKTYPSGSANGCDSVLTLNITIHDLPDVSTTLNGMTITANLSGATYQWIDCDNGNTPITGATSSSFTATEEGNYAVIVDDGDCADTSACVEVKSVGINKEVVSGFGIEIYPNPTRDLLNVVLNNTNKEGFTVELLDALGKVIKTHSVKSNAVSLNMTNYHKGVYFVRVSNDAEQMTYRVIKQ